ncbi:hypothetical protein FQN54_004506 [Arachnomyces sp. PD_36]|nr:hypothetical protein FQN54_004506 [Arachnomyces sp. PD_36]
MAPPVREYLSANPAPSPGPSIERHNGYNVNELAQRNTAEWRISDTGHEAGAIDRNRNYPSERDSNGTREERPTSREITSFLDSDSELEEDRSDVIQRADTVRVCRPRLVQHMPPTTTMRQAYNAGDRANVQQMQTQQFAGPSNYGEYARSGYRPELGLPVDESGLGGMRYEPYQVSIDESMPDSITDGPVSDEEDARSLDIVYCPIRNKTGESQSCYNPGGNRGAGLQSHPTTRATSRPPTRRREPRQSLYVQTEGVRSQGVEHGHREPTESNPVAMPYPRSGYPPLAGNGEKGFQRPQDGLTGEDISITLGLSGRWARRYTIVITIPADYPGKFDDAALFKQIRKSYHQNLLPVWKRWLSFRSLGRVFLRMPSPEDNSSAEHHDGTGTSCMERTERFGFDASSFLAHLQHPKLGTGNTVWLAWLRQHQDLFAPDSQPHSSRLRLSSTIEVGPNSTRGGAQRPHSSTGFRESTLTEGAGDPVGSTEETAISPKAIIQLQHLLSPVLVSFAVISILLLSILATVLYITLAPGTSSPRPGIPTPLPTPNTQAPGLGFRDSPSSKDWRLFKVSFDIDHQARQNWWSLVSVRVPAGFLVGFVVLAFGVVGLLGWIGVAVLAWRRSTGSTG